MSLHIGEKIKAKIIEKGWSLARFAEEASMTYRNAMYLLKRDDLSVEQLRQISKVLEYDFMKDFSLYPEVSVNTEYGLVREPVAHIATKDYTTMGFSLTIAGDSSTFERFPELIKKVRKSADDLGFKIL